jgi:RNA polymerase sigma-70 factor (ECF subfamily)
MSTTPGTGQHDIKPTCERFVTTHWSQVVLAANYHSPDSAQALEKLCRAYWPPLYCYLRRGGRSPHEAEDLTQGFFAQLFERNSLAAASADRGRFRNFLLTALKNFVVNEWRSQHTQKKGGQFQILSLDAQTNEGLYVAEPGDHLTPEVLYDKHWALTVIERVMDRLRGEYTAIGKNGLFEDLKYFLVAKKGTPHAELAQKHGFPVSTIGVIIHRLRDRYGELLREEIASTVSDPAEIDGEIRYLISALGN